MLLEDNTKKTLRIFGSCNVFVQLPKVTGTAELVQSRTDSRLTRRSGRYEFYHGIPDSDQGRQH